MNFQVRLFLLNMIQQIYRDIAEHLLEQLNKINWVICSRMQSSD